MSSLRAFWMVLSPGVVKRLFKNKSQPWDHLRCSGLRVAFVVEG